jgi:hypothetical protein
LCKGHAVAGGPAERVNGDEVRKAYFGEASMTW